MNEVQPLAGLGARIELAREPAFALGGLAISPATLETAQAEQRQILQPRVMQVLVALARRKGEVVSRDELIWSCWDGLSVSDHAINRCISQLRRVAGDGKNFEIETIPRVGYRLTDVSDPVVVEPAAPGPLAALAPAPPGVRPLRGRDGLVAVAVAALIAAVLGVWMFSQFRNTPVAEAQVAVLPAEALSADPDLPYFAQGMTDQIVGLLTDTDIRVTQATAPAHQARFTLGASVERDSEQLRVRLHTDDSSGTTVWSKEFARDRGQASALQLEVAAKAADALAFSLMCVPSSAADSSLLSLCIRAAELLRESDFPQARILLAELVDKAPQSGFAHLLLASAALGEKAIARGERRAALSTEARNEAERALSIDPSLTDAHRIHAASLPTRAWTQREAALRTAMKYEKSASAFLKSNANGGLGRFLLDAGRASEAAPYLQRASTLDPLSPNKTVAAAAMLEALGRLDEAKAILERCVRIWPRDYAVRLYQRYFVLMYGSKAEALALLDEPNSILPLQPAAEDALHAFTQARFAPDSSLTSKAARVLSDAANAGWIDPRLAIPALATLGDIDAAFAHAERLFSDEFAETTLLFTPATAPLRRDSRFIALAAKAGLIDYWQSNGTWPDVCKQPGSAYDCSAVARSLSATDASP